VNAPPILQRHPALRWLAPVGVLCAAAMAATGLFQASASSESLPRTTPAALIAAVQRTEMPSFSGTVVTHLSLGLPELPAIGNTGDGTSFTSLLSGSHTLQVWYGGLDKQRIALLGSTDETDVFRDGTQMWQWSSADKVAVHAVLPAVPASASAPQASTSSLTPAQVARSALGALDPTTRVQVRSDHSVADRSSYELVLTPRTHATKVGSVHIAVDGQTKVPLGVQVYARGSSTPSVDVGFTNIVFAHQPERNFQFSPPRGASVRQAGTPRVGTHPPASAAKDGPQVTRTGSGWTTVYGLHPGAAAITALRKNGVLNSLDAVSGSWGSGRLLDSDLVSVLITTDGRLFAGAVAPTDLYAAAGR
jgi:outer membrane lipoprotein-sorting protein